MSIKMPAGIAKTSHQETFNILKAFKLSNIKNTVIEIQLFAFTSQS